jgi:hypothetical protein
MNNYDQWTRETIRKLEERAPGEGLRELFVMSNYLIDWPDVPLFDDILAGLRRLKRVPEITPLVCLFCRAPISDSGTCPHGCVQPGTARRQGALTYTPWRDPDAPLEIEIDMEDPRD